MIDWLLQLVETIIPALHVLAVLAVIGKFILIVGAKGFDLPAVFTSFFRLYSTSELRMTDNRSRRRYMRTNNVLNYYLYAWLILTIIVAVVFGSLY